MLTLTRPARYYPLQTGRYDVAPGLKPLGAPFGNGEADGFVFQIDREWERYRQSKLRCRAERLEKYGINRDYEPHVAAAVARLIAGRLLTEHPSLFAHEENPGGGSALSCRLTRETLEFDAQMSLRASRCGPGGAAPYMDAFDALCSQVQEDVAVVSTSPERGDWLSALHIFSPSYWAAEEKIGRPFVEVHAPVPGIEPTIRVAPALVETMVRRGPYVRFVWGVSTDNRLNHHPEPPPGISPEEWHGRRFFDPAAEVPFYVRIERQVIWGLSEVDAALFTIRTYHLDGREVRSNPQERALLRSGLLSMSPESRVYKGVAAWLDPLLVWLDSATAPEPEHARNV